MERKAKLFTVSIKDCDVQTFCAGGKGGQHQNKTETGVRVIHRASGAVGESRETRSQLTNKRAAFTRMARSLKFQLWVRRQAGVTDPDKPTRTHRGYGARYLRTYDFMDRIVKDHDTGHIRHDVEAVMNGDIDSFIAARMLASSRPKE